MLSQHSIGVDIDSSMGLPAGNTMIMADRHINAVDLIELMKLDLMQLGLRRVRASTQVSEGDVIVGVLWCCSFIEGRAV